MVIYTTEITNLVKKTVEGFIAFNQAVNTRENLKMKSFMGTAF